MAFDADPYRTLGLTRGASIDEVKRAYRRLAKANHPDAAGPGALPRFLAIQAAYEKLAGGSAAPFPGRGDPTARRRSSGVDGDRTDATRRAYGGRQRASRPGAGPTGGPGPNSRDGHADERGGGTRDSGRSGPSRPAGRERAGDTGAAGTGGSGSSGHSGSGDSATGPARGKASLGSTSYDGADAGPFEPDWGGASWYGTTSGTYWTINPKEYADPRKHGPEYQARARRSSSAGSAGTHANGGSERAARAEDSRADPNRATDSWWESTSGPKASEAGTTPPAEPASTRAWRPTNRARRPFRADASGAGEPAPDPAHAAVDLARALTDPVSGGLRGRVLRAVLGWLPIALGLGWLVGEVTGCGRFAATCDPSVAPLTAVGQGIVLAALLLLPEVAAIAAGAALVLLAAATAASLILSATGTAADEESRRAALGALLVIAWLSGLAMTVLRPTDDRSRILRACPDVTTSAICRPRRRSTCWHCG